LPSDPIKSLIFQDRLLDATSPCMSFSSMPDQDRPFRLRQTDSRFAPVTRHDATGSSRRRTTLSAKGDSRRSWSDNGFHGRYVSAGEVEPGFHVEPEPSVGLMLQSWEIRRDLGK
jgi:hypothetical protein